MGEGQFARAVNRAAAETGLVLRYDQPSISNWLSGTLPRKIARPFVVEALSRRLGRALTHTDLGFPPPAAHQNAQAGMSTVEELVELGRSDMDPSRRGVLSAGVFSAAMAVPGWSEAAERVTAVSTGRASRVGMAEVRVVKDMTERLSGMCDEFGGGYARPLAAAFVANHLGDHLRADAPGHVRRAMAREAAFLCYLTGWMAVDEGDHAMAQRWYLTALELAAEAGDRDVHCHVLRGMSVQAADLGHGPLAVRLADAAAEAAPGATPRMRAFYAGQQAHAFAVAGERTGALRALRETETALDRAESGLTTFGGYAPSTLAYTTAQVRHGLGDTAGSVSSFRLHFRLRDAGDSRGSAVRFGALMAERQLTAGHLDAACETWHRVLDDYEGIRSGRADERVGGIRGLLRPYLGNRGARALDERVRGLGVGGRGTRGGAVVSRAAGSGL
ncbi:tetratricopeptide repeat protein [Streptomyces sp. MP131-18]|uniref:tetratricopeptide repeat protein n=1 Tax=Streptomyces sp. MP131-18 TaxID=1857892 RepID=UPI00344C5063